jgi:hypothetical protein
LQIPGLCSLEGQDWLWTNMDEAMISRNIFFWKRIITIFFVCVNELEVRKCNVLCFHAFYFWKDYLSFVLLSVQSLYVVPRVVQPNKEDSLHFLVPGPERFFRKGTGTIPPTLHRKRSFSIFPSFSLARDITYQTLPGQE